jgi:hypothetical protein
MANSVPFTTKIVGAGLLEVRLSKLDLIAAEGHPDQALDGVVRAVRCSMDQVVRVDQDRDVDEVILTIDHKGELSDLTWELMADLNKRGATRQDLTRAASKAVSLSQRLKTMQEVRDKMFSELEPAQEVTTQGKYADLMRPSRNPGLSSKVVNWLKRDLKDGLRVLRWFRRFWRRS